MRSSQYEHALEKEGVTYAYEPALSLAQIDRVKSLQNQARLAEPIDESLVDEYEAALRGGAQFPPLVAWRPGKGRFILADGNNRLAALAKVGREAHDAYILECKDPQVIDRLCWRWNNLVNGKRLTREEAMEHAVTFVRKYGLGVEKAASMWGIHRFSLGQRILLDEDRDLLRRNNVALTPALTETKLRILRPLQKAGEDLYVAAARVAAVGAADEDVEDLVRRVAAARTAQAKLAAVEEFAASDRMQDRRAETKNGALAGGHVAPRDRFAKALRQLLKVLEDYPEKAIQPRNSDWKVQRERAADVVERLVGMFGLGAIPPGAQKAVS